MAVNRRTDTTEFVEDITLTVAPLNGGSVGINEPNPTRGTFQIEDTSVREINSDSSIVVVNGHGGVSLVSGWGPTLFGTPGYYREGSRVYFESKLQWTSAAGVYNMGDTIFTLDTYARPASSLVEQFVVSIQAFIPGTSNVASDGMRSKEVFQGLLSVANLTGNVSLTGVYGTRVPPAGISGGEQYYPTQLFAANNSPTRNSATDPFVNQLEAKDASTPFLIDLSGISFRVSGGTPSP